MATFVELKQVYEQSVRGHSGRSIDFPVPSIDVGAFVQALNKSGLANKDFVASLSQELRDDPSIKTLGNLLIDSMVLTKWQLEKLMRGRWKSFFVRDFELREHLGTGRILQNYLGRKRQTGKSVRISVYADIEESHQLARWLSERLRIISPAHHSFNVDERQYFVRDYVDGISLFAVVQGQGTLPPKTANTCLLHLCKLIANLHERQLLMLTLNPRNVLISSDGRISITTIGLPASRVWELSFQPLGSPAPYSDFVAPEARHGRDTNESADVFSLGGILFFLLTGASPKDYVGERESIAARLRHQEVHHAETLATLISRLLQADPDDRNCSLTELSSELDVLVRN